MKRSDQLKWNTIAAFTVQVSAILSSFIVPKCILNAYGSATNGLVSSITGFLGFLTLMESGVGSVARAELYRPVANRDTAQISAIVNATHRFFKKIALLYLAFVAAFALVFPFAADTSEDFWYAFFLVLIIAITNFVQYYFGAGYMQVLYADQKIYILYAIQAASYLLSIATTICLTDCGAGIHAVKLASALAFIIRPVVVHFYVKKKYAIQSHATSKTPVLGQKWNNMLQTIAYFVHSKTDIVVLTVFCAFEDVSVYSVYAMITTGLSSIISSVCNGFTSKIGGQYSRNDQKLHDTFSAYELFVYNLTAICFATAAGIMQDFISVYIGNLTDAEYYQPAFCTILVLAEAMYCIRMPYNNMVSAAGQFRQTQYAAVIEAGINIILSTVLVWRYGLIGVAVGTLVAMMYRTIYLVFYLSRNLLKRSVRIFVKNVLIFGGASLVSVLVSSRVITYIHSDSYLTLAVEGAIALAISVAAVGFTDAIMFSRESKQLLREFTKGV